jgi:hypothetical protein
MKAEVTLEGITVSIAPGDPDRKLEAQGRVFCVYAHSDKAGNIFYVGKRSGHCHPDNLGRDDIRRWDPMERRCWAERKPFSADVVWRDPDGRCCERDGVK